MQRPTLSDRATVKVFNTMRRLYAMCRPPYRPQQPAVSTDPAAVNSHIAHLLHEDKPVLIGRFGSNELDCTVFANNWWRHRYDMKNYVCGRSDIWWYPDAVVHQMHYNAGFFSPSTEQLDRFGHEMTAAMPLIDVLGSWRDEEGYFEQELSQAMKVDLELLNPLWGSNICPWSDEKLLPWSAALEGRRVLVVHPFAETIRRQYQRRQQIHHDSRVLPAFSLEVIPAVQSITGMKPEGFDTWFDALHHMERQIDSHDYDVCLVGCGAYGLLLAAHCKCMGKKAIHLGGALQLLFGIKGRRWEDPDYGFGGMNYLQFVTPAWVRPSENETPKRSADIEEGCYW